MNILCWKCKGRGYCKRGFCVINEKLGFQKNFNERAKQDFFGSTYNIFVGRFGYPNVNVGFLTADEKNDDYDSPRLWINNKYDISKIMHLRTLLINSHYKSNIKNFNDKLAEMSKDVSLSIKPVDVEVNLEKKPEFHLSFSQDITPFGPSVKIIKARLTENPKIPHKVDYIINDELKAHEQLKILSKKGFDEHYLAKLLSVGNLGLKNNKKLVPTRWSITATDDILGKQMIQKIKDCPISEYYTFFGGVLGNFYLVLVFPYSWSYELFETHANSLEFMTDYEDFNGRKDYASETAGGYYAARLAILEKLSNMKKQASILVIRIITDEYYAPLGVWVVREATRQTMQNKPLEFETQNLMLNYARALIKKKFNKDIEIILQKSKLLKNMNTQKKLFMYC